MNTAIASAVALTASAIRTATAELLSELDERSRRIITRRFGLDGKLPRTLHAIGAEEGVTRERIRQIEQSVLRAFRGEHPPRSSRERSSTLTRVRGALQDTLLELGGVAREDLLANLLRLKDDIDRAALRFLLLSLPRVREIRETEQTVRHFRQKESAHVEEILGTARTVLQGAKRLLSDHGFLREVRQQTGGTSPELALRSVLSLARDVVRTPFGEWGLRGWAEATPRGVGDKAYVVLKRVGKPLHFMTITERINVAGFDRRTAHAQTVHNELIRDARFVLVGRGLYALREWGYEPGTVAEVLERILRSSAAPLPRDELVATVLRERIVKRNTVLLALQNRSRFTRQSDGRYTLAAKHQHSPDAGQTRPNAPDATPRDRAADAAPQSTLPPTEGAPRGN